jgi:hypothetical protein
VSSCDLSGVLCFTFTHWFAFTRDLDVTAFRIQTLEKFNAKPARTSSRLHITSSYNRFLLLFLSLPTHKMPHKHTRRGSPDKTTFDLPPTSRAAPLPVKTSQSSVFTPKKANIKRKRSKDATADDTPKQFARLMRWNNSGIKLPKGLDDGNDRRPSKKRKRANNADDSPAAAAAATESKTSAPKILPGERLSEFAARVDQALPLSNLASLNSRKDGKPLDPALAKSLKGRPTKHNKRLLRMQKEWREEEARRKAKREEQVDEDEEKNEREGNLWGGVGGALGATKKRKGGSTAVAGLEGEDEDPWAELTRKKREATKMKNLQDVVQAPPQLDHRKAIGKGRIFRGVVVDVENVPAAVGSLRKREEVASTRREVIEQYRQRRGGKWENREFASDSD